MINPDFNQNKKFRDTHIRLLDALHAICQKHDITYWIDFGTLLGAHFNNYFIPWDDDVDVSMPMKDYKKFLEVAGKELPKDIFLQTPQTDPAYKQTMAKLRDCYSTLIEHHETDHEGYHQGIYLDVFPSVRYPRLPTLFKKVLLLTTIRSRHRAYVKGLWWYHPVYWFCKLIWLLLSPFKTNLMAQIPEDNGYYLGIPDTLIFPLKDIEFAGKMYPGPNKVHEYLATIWPRYTPTPPIESRVSHAREILVDRPCNHPRAMHRNEQRT